MMLRSSILEWWQWLLCGLVCWCLSLFLIVVWHKNEKLGRFTGPVSLLAGLAGIVPVVIGLIRFIKWAWNS